MQVPIPLKEIRDPVKCLENNYSNQEPVLDFFRAGHYTADQRIQAEGELIRSISILASRVNEVSDSTSNIETWAKDIMMNGFEFLGELDEFWGNIALAHKAADIAARNASGVFVSSKKRLRSYSSSSLPRTKPKIEVEVKERDGIRITGLDVSLGTYMKYKAIKSPRPTNKKEVYFKSLGENSIVDISDPNEGSHLHLLNQKQQKQVKELFICQLNYKDLYSKKLRKIVKSAVKQSPKHAAKSIHKYLSNDCKDIEAGIARAILVIVERHALDSTAFERGNFELLSEADLIIKFWGALIENVFLGSRIRPHWGETVPSVFIATTATPKMDLRLICFGSNQGKEDLGVGEFGKTVQDRKYYHDKRKLVLVAKAQVNYYIQTYSLNSEQVPDVKIPIIQVLGSRAEISVVKMEASGLYTVELLHEFMLPISIQSFKEDMSCLIKGLSILTELTKQLSDKLSDLSKKQSPFNITIKQMKEPKARPTAGTTWTREIIYDDSYDNENI